MNQMIASQANGEHSPDNDNDTGDVRRPDETIPADTSANDSDTPKARAQADITADRTSGNTPEHSETHTLDKNKDLSSSEETSSISQGAVANKPDKAQKEKANSQQAELIGLWTILSGKKTCVINDCSEHQADSWHYSVSKGCSGVRLKNKNLK